MREEDEFRRRLEEEQFNQRLNAETSRTPATRIAGKSVVSSPSGPLVDTEALLQTAKDVPGHFGRAFRGFAQGAVDLPVGAAQLISKMGPEEVDQMVGDYIRRREEEYTASRGDYADRADVGRVTGSVVASMPLGGKAAAPTLLGRMGQGAKIGGAMGLATPVNPDTENFAFDKGVQAVGGAVVGALSAPLAEMGVRVIGAVANKVSDFIKGFPKRASNKTTQDAIEQTLIVELKRAGADWGEISKQSRDAMVLETQKALRAGGAIDVDAVSRIADFQKLGMQPTRGQVSRDPYQFAAERNLGKMEVGQPLANRFTEQNNQLIRSVDELRAKRGSSVGDAYQSGKNTMKVLRAKDAASKKTVSDAYTAAREKLGYEADVPLQPVAQKLGEVIEEVGSENIPAAVMSRLKEFGLMDGKQTRVFNIREAEKLRKLIGNNMPGMNSPIDAALMPLKSSIDDAIMSLETRGDLVGTEAATALKGARELASKRFQKIESIPALADMLKKKTIPPEDFVNNYVIRGSVDEVKTLMRTLPPGSRKDVRATVVDWIKGKAVSGTGDSATFTQSGFNKAIDNIGERNLRSIFGGEKALEDLRLIGRVAASVQKAPVSSGVNYSSSATTIMDMLDQVGKLPIISAVAGKVPDIAKASTVMKSLSPMGPTKSARPFVTLELLDELARRAGRVAAPVGAGTVLSK